jgi:DNA-binding winged helix-turn-helix (wHTH) protein/tetratricopeptide (TPR) repeat protein
MNLSCPFTGLESWRMKAMTDPVYEFEGFRLDTRRRVLMVLGDQRSVPLKPKEYDTLLFFVERAGQLLDKTTLMQGIWPRVVVEENNLNQHIAALRRLLGEERGDRRFIMNVRSRGYRFVPDVMRVEMSSPRAAMNAAPPSSIAAWQCYQQAIFLTGMEDPARWSSAVELLSRAVKLDAAFASAWALLAQLQVRLLSIDWRGARALLDSAEEAARRASALRPDLASPRMAAGSVAAARGRWVEAEEHFEAAAALDEDWPLVGDAHAAHVLLGVGHVRRALLLTRVSHARGHGMVGIVLIHALANLANDDDEEAAEAMKLIAVMGGQPNRPHFAEVLARLAQRARRSEEAAERLNAALPEHVKAAGGDRVTESVLSAVVTQRGTRAAIDAVDQLRTRLQPSFSESTRHRILSWYAELGAFDRAYEFADETLDDFSRSGMVGILWSYLWFRELRGFRRDARFTGFATRLGLTQYWNRFGPPDDP